MFPSLHFEVKKTFNLQKDFYYFVKQCCPIKSNGQFFFSNFSATKNWVLKIGFSGDDVVKHREA